MFSQTFLGNQSFSIKQKSNCVCSNKQVLKIQVIS
jgi:hypothetical protein